MTQLQERYAPLIILGSGPAGYTAGIYAARANLRPLIIGGVQLGGQLTTTTEVGNWPGGSEFLQGPELMQMMQAQVKRLGVEVVQDQITALDLKSQPFSMKGQLDTVYRSHALIVATGARAKYLGLPSEVKFQGRGVSACATCDGFLYRNQTVAVVGGGNTALEEALYLSRIAKKTILIHRRGEFRAEKMLQQKFFERVKQGAIELQLDSVVHEIEGDDSGVTAVSIKNVFTQQVASISIQCIFIAIGHHPNTELFEGQLTLQGGYIRLPEVGTRAKVRTSTNIPGVFAAGDVADPLYRQAITAAATGCMAALDAEQYLDQLKILT